MGCGQDPQEELRYLYRVDGKWVIVREERRILLTIADFLESPTFELVETTFLADL